MKNALMILIFLPLAAVSAAEFNYVAVAAPAASSEDDATPLFSDWQTRNEQSLKAALADEEIAGFTGTEAAALGLIARVKPDYQTDPLDACRIAEANHWVMVDADSSWYEFWRAHRQSGRRVWTEALLKSAEAAPDDYVKIFCLEQLRWCGRSDQTARIARIGERSGSKAVKDFVCWVVRELGD